MAKALPIFEDGGNIVEFDQDLKLFINHVSQYLDSCGKESWFTWGVHLMPNTTCSRDEHIVAEAAAELKAIANQCIVVLLLFSYSLLTFVGVQRALSTADESMDLDSKAAPAIVTDLSIGLPQSKVNSLSSAHMLRAHVKPRPIAVKVLDICLVKTESSTVTAASAAGGVTTSKFKGSRAFILCDHCAKKKKNKAKLCWVTADGSKCTQADTVSSKGSASFFVNKHSRVDESNGASSTNSLSDNELEGVTQEMLSIVITDKDAFVGLEHTLDMLKWWCQVSFNIAVTESKLLGISKEAEEKMAKMKHLLEFMKAHKEKGRA
ncbi:hypothetical protein EW146_g3318 [Bondarzewia mesenterica]|uniref:Uncharacterized protein n=1 Tax=Bondarzewia mesenterica TaxID=1095465 RepID=A0A4S4M062_9AGAM|nr:hypothetical protein EW146_g3318 [Bondarzewia mesenterica]